MNTTPIIPVDARANFSATYKFEVWAHQDTFNIYLGWEYGSGKFRQEPVSKPVAAYFKTKKEALRFAERVRQVAIASDGRIGDRGVFVR